MLLIGTLIKCEECESTKLIIDAEKAIVYCNPCGLVQLENIVEDFDFSAFEEGDDGGIRPSRYMPTMWSHLFDISYKNLGSLIFPSDVGKVVRKNADFINSH